MATRPSRIEALRGFMEANPGDPFPRYGYAMELKNQGLLEDAAVAFAELQQRFPDYVAQYLMHQGVLVALRRPDEARQVCQLGLEAARHKGDGHAEGELHQALDALEHGAS